MNEQEQIIWELLGSTGTVHMTKENIYLRLDEGLMIVAQPRTSIQWGYNDQMSIVADFKVKP